MLNFLGVGAAFNFEKDNNCAYFKLGNDLYLFDCGEKICDKMIEHKLFDNVKNIYCFITHLHSDHIGSLEALLYYVKGFTDAKLYVFYPKKANLKKLLILMGINFEFEILDNYDLVKDIKIEPVKQKHIPGSYGYFVYTNKENFFYSGDTCIVNKRAVKELKQGKIDKIYHEVTIYKTAVIHTHISLLEDSIPKNLRNKVWLMHFADKKTEEYAKKQGFGICKEI